MSFNPKNLTYGQLVAAAAGVFVICLVVVGVIIAATGQTAQKVSIKRPVQFDKTSSANDLDIEKMRVEIARLTARLDESNKNNQAAFEQTALAVDLQSQNIATLDKNVQVTSGRVNSLEIARLGAKVNVVKQEEGPSRAERLAAAEPKTSVSTKPMKVADNGNYKVLSTVGNRAWIRSGDEEINVREGEAIPLNGQLVVKRVTPNGQVLVDVESTR